MNGDRDDGDGSSNGTMPGHEEMGQSHGDSDGQITPTPTPTPSQQGNGQCFIFLSFFLPGALSSWVGWKKRAENQPTTGKLS